MTQVLLIAAFISFSSNLIIAQTDRIAVKNINSYIKIIDSLIDKDYKHVFIVNSIAEGLINQEVVTTSINKSKNRVDTTRKKMTGGWSKYTAQNHKADTVYRIQYHDNIQKNFYLVFYFRNNFLVYSKLDYQEDSIGQTFYKRQEYYEESNLVFVNETKDKIDEEFRGRTGINLYKKGLEYYQEFAGDQ